MRDTSLEARISIDLNNLETIVYDYIESCESKGTTCDEAEIKLRMRHQTCSARFTALNKKGKIVDSTRRRLTRTGRRAIVWVVAEPQTKQGLLF